MYVTPLRAVRPVRVEPRPITRQVLWDGRPRYGHAPGESSMTAQRADLDPRIHSTIDNSPRFLAEFRRLRQVPSPDTTRKNVLVKRTYLTPPLQDEKRGRISARRMNAAARRVRRVRGLAPTALMVVSLPLHALIAARVTPWRRGVPSCGHRRSAAANCRGPVRSERVPLSNCLVRR